jgi:hypothetical protein
VFALAPQQQRNMMATNPPSTLPVANIHSSTPPGLHQAQQQLHPSAQFDAFKAALELSVAGQNNIMPQARVSVPQMQQQLLLLQQQQQQLQPHHHNQIQPNPQSSPLGTRPPLSQSQSRGASQQRAKRPSHKSVKSNQHGPSGESGQAAMAAASHVVQRQANNNLDGSPLAPFPNAHGLGLSGGSPDMSSFTQAPVPAPVQQMQVQANKQQQTDAPVQNKIRTPAQRQRKASTGGSKSGTSGAATKRARAPATGVSTTVQRPELHMSTPQFEEGLQQPLQAPQQVEHQQLQQQQFRQQQLQHLQQQHLQQQHMQQQHMQQQHLQQMQLQQHLQQQNLHHHLQQQQLQQLQQHNLQQHQVQQQQLQQHQLQQFQLKQAITNDQSEERTLTQQSAPQAQVPSPQNAQSTTLKHRAKEKQPKKQGASHRSKQVKNSKAQSQDHIQIEDRQPLAQQSQVLNEAGQQPHIVFQQNLHGQYQLPMSDSLLESQQQQPQFSHIQLQQHQYQLHHEQQQLQRPQYSEQLQQRHEHASPNQQQHARRDHRHSTQHGQVEPSQLHQEQQLLDYNGKNGMQQTAPKYMHEQQSSGLTFSQGLHSFVGSAVSPEQINENPSGAFHLIDPASRWAAAPDSANHVSSTTGSRGVLGAASNAIASTNPPDTSKPSNAFGSLHAAASPETRAVKPSAPTRGPSSTNRNRQRPLRPKSRAAPSKASTGQPSQPLVGMVETQKQFQRAEIKPVEHVQQIMQMQLAQDEHRRAAEAASIAERKRVRLENAPSKDQQRTLIPDYVTPFGCKIDGRIDAWQRLLPYHCLHTTDREDLDQEDWQERINELVKSYATWLIRLRSGISDVDLRFGASCSDPIAVTTSQEPQRKRMKNCDEALSEQPTIARKERLKSGVKFGHGVGSEKDKDTSSELLSLHSRSDSANHVNGASNSPRDNASTSARVIAGFHVNGPQIAIREIANPGNESESCVVAGDAGTDLSITDEIVLQRLLLDDEELLKEPQRRPVTLANSKPVRQGHSRFDSSSETRPLQITPPRHMRTDLQPHSASLKVSSDQLAIPSLTKASPQPIIQAYRSPSVSHGYRQADAIEQPQDCFQYAPDSGQKTISQIPQFGRVPDEQVQLRSDRYSRAPEMRISPQLEREKSLNAVPSDPVEALDVFQDSNFHDLQNPHKEHATDLQSRLDRRGERQSEEYTPGLPLPSSSQVQSVTGARKFDTFSPLARRFLPINNMQNVVTHDDNVDKNLHQMQEPDEFFAVAHRDYRGIDDRNTLNAEQFADPLALHASGSSANLEISSPQASPIGLMPTSLEILPQISHGTQFSARPRQPGIGDPL